MSIAAPSTPSFAPRAAAASSATPAGRLQLEPAVTEHPLLSSVPAQARARSTWPARLAAALAAGAAIVILLGIVGQWLERVRHIQHSFGFVFQFAPDEEGNFATWYASTLLLTCAALLGAIAWRCAADDRYRRHWVGLAALLVLMSADETAQFHEMLIAPLRSIWNTGGVFHFAWVIPGMAAVACVALACATFVRDLQPRTRRLFVAAAAVYLGGALGVEMIGGYYASQWGSATFAYGLLTSVEEGMELAGAVLFAYGLADHLMRISNRETRSTTGDA